MQSVDQPILASDHTGHQLLFKPLTLQPCHSGPNRMGPSFDRSSRTLSAVSPRLTGLSAEALLFDLYGVGHILLWGFQGLGFFFLLSIRLNRGVDLNERQCTIVKQTPPSIYKACIQAIGSLSPGLSLSTIFVPSNGRFVDSGHSLSQIDRYFTSSTPSSLV